MSLVVILLAIAVSIFSKHELSDYSQDLIAAFDNAREIEVSEVFDFKFDRAYVLHDCYISGDGFTSAYGLDLSISEVKPGTSENIHRIVFVDKDGNYIYDFQYDTNQVNFDNKGVVIYPSTRMIQCTPLIAGAITLHFASTEYYTDNTVSP